MLLNIKDFSYSLDFPKLADFSLLKCRNTNASKSPKHLRSFIENNKIQKHQILILK